MKHIVAQALLCLLLVGASGCTKSVEIITGDANEAVNEVLHRVHDRGDSTLGFAFIDPPGIEIRVETMARLAPAHRPLGELPLGYEYQAAVQTNHESRRPWVDS